MLFSAGLVARTRRGLLPAHPFFTYFPPLRNEARCNLTYWFFLFLLLPRYPDHFVLYCTNMFRFFSMYTVYPVLSLLINFVLHYWILSHFRHIFVFNMAKSSAVLNIPLCLISTDCSVYVLCLNCPTFTSMHQSWRCYCFIYQFYIFPCLSHWCLRKVHSNMSLLCEPAYCMCLFTSEITEFSICSNVLQSTII
jgi:hypothetical protein